MKEENKLQSAVSLPFLLPHFTLPPALVHIHLTKFTRDVALEFNLEYSLTLITYLPVPECIRPPAIQWGIAEALAQFPLSLLQVQLVSNAVQVA